MDDITIKCHCGTEFCIERDDKGLYRVEGDDEWITDEHLGFHISHLMYEHERVSCEDVE